MAFFQPYTGMRVAPVPSGYLGAAATHAASVQKGYESAGDSISDALKQYGAKKQESDFLTERFTNLKGHLDKIMGSLPDENESLTGDINIPAVPGGMIPAGAPGTQGLGSDSLGAKSQYRDRIAKEIAGFEDLSLPKKRAKMMSLEFEIDQFYKEGARNAQALQNQINQNVLDDRAAYESVLKNAPPLNTTENILRGAPYRGVNIDTPEARGELIKALGDPHYSKAMEGLRPVSGARHHASPEDMRALGGDIARKVGGDISGALKSYAGGLKKAFDPLAKVGKSLAAGEFGAINPEYTRDPDVYEYASSERNRLKDLGYNSYEVDKMLPETRIDETGVWTPPPKDAGPDWRGPNPLTDMGPRGPVEFPLQTSGGRLTNVTDPETGMAIDMDKWPIGEWTQLYNSGTMPDNVYTVTANGRESASEIAIRESGGTSRFWELNPHLQMSGPGASIRQQKMPLPEGTKVLIEPKPDLSQYTPAVKRVAQAAKPKKSTATTVRGWAEGAANTAKAVAGGAIPAVKFVDIFMRSRGGIANAIQEGYPDIYKSMKLDTLKLDTQQLVDEVSSALKGEEGRSIIDMALKPGGMFQAVQRTLAIYANKNEKNRKAAVAGGWDPAAAADKAYEAGKDFVADLTAHAKRVPKLDISDRVELETFEKDRPKTWKEAHREMVDYLAASDMEISPGTVKALEGYAKSQYAAEEPGVISQPIEGFAGAKVLFTKEGKFIEVVKPATMSAEAKAALDARTVLPYTGWAGVTPSKEEAVKFRSLNSNNNDIQDSLDKLISMAEAGKVKFWGDDLAAANALRTSLVGKMRIPMTGGGPLTKEEREYISSNLMTNPYSATTLRATTISTLKTVQWMMNNAVNRTAEGVGLERVGGSTPTGGTSRNYTNDPRLTGRK